MDTSPLPFSPPPIGLFDSGFGGLTVLRALQTRLPGENFLYFADTRFLPYGDRPESFLRRRGLAIAQHLMDQGVKAIVIACNTATATAAESIRALCPVPVVALEPAIKPAALLTKSRKIGVLATTLTLRSERFQRLVKTYAENCTVIPQPCPGLAEAIEQHGPESPEVEYLLDIYTAPLHTAGVDVLVLGCTHYPWIGHSLNRRFGPDVHIVDTGDAVARQLERCLQASGSLHHLGQGHIHVQTSGNPTLAGPTIRRLWGELLPITAL